MDDEYKFWQYLIPYEASKYTMGIVTGKQIGRAHV